MPGGVYPFGFLPLGGTGMTKGAGYDILNQFDEIRNSLNGETEMIIQIGLK